MQLNQPNDGIDNQQYVMNENGEVVINENYQQNYQVDQNKLKFQQQMGRVN